MLSHVGLRRSELHKSSAQGSWRW